MKISNFLREELVVPNIQATRKLDVIRELSEHLATREPSIASAGDVAEVLTAREELGSTALAEGLAIPHGKLESVPKLVGCFGRSKKGVDFASRDGRPTHFFVVVIAPPECGGEHLKALAQISRIFRQDGVRKRLLRASTAADILRILTEYDAGT